MKFIARLFGSRNREATPTPTKRSLVPQDREKRRRPQRRASGIEVTAAMYEQAALFEEEDLTREYTSEISERVVLQV